MPDHATDSPIERREIRHFHLFCGLGAGARGFNRGTARVGNLHATFRCLGGIDVSAAAIRDFGKLAGVPGTLLDLFHREQYAAFHGRQPAPDWREATPADIQAAAGGERPHIVFLSAPCKGFSGLLPESRSLTDKYQALNSLTLRGIWLMLEAWRDDPPELVVFENVPRIATRGRALLDRIGALLRHHGYAVAETAHDCGELGGLAQSRKRFLLVARHMPKVPPFLYEPPKRPLRAVGDVLGRMPLPGDPRAGPMHRVPSLQWQTWIRLAFVEAGADWRSLQRLHVANGQLADFRLMPECHWHSGVLGVYHWRGTAGTVTGSARLATGAFSVADPRYDGRSEYGQLGVQKWTATASTVRHVKSPIQGRFSVADPRHAGPAKFGNVYRVVPWNRHAQAVTSGRDVAVADPRTHWPGATHGSKLRVTPYEECSGTVTGSDRVGSGAPCVADPGRDERRAGGFDDPGRTTRIVTGSNIRADERPVGDPAFRPSGDSAEPYDDARLTVADPDQPHPDQPRPTDRLITVIRSLDGTWHRPFTTLELAALQSLIEPEETLELDGLSDAAWRERIGNAVPPDAATAIASTMGLTLLLAWTSAGFTLSSLPIWVRPVAVAVSVRPAVE